MSFLQLLCKNPSKHRNDSMLLLYNYNIRIVAKNIYKIHDDDLFNTIEKGLIFNNNNNNNNNNNMVKKIKINKIIKPIISLGCIEYVEYIKKFIIPKVYRDYIMNPSSIPYLKDINSNNNSNICITYGNNMRTFEKYDLKNLYKYNKKKRKKNIDNNIILYISINIVLFVIIIINILFF